MHPYLLKVPNVLFYGNEIESGYKKTYETRFIHDDLPFLFINIESKEIRYGTSYINDREAEIIKDLIIYLTRN